MKTTIVIGAYNKTELTQKILKDLNNQTSKEFNLILIDDGSSEKLTLEKLPEFKKGKLIFIANYQNLGVAQTWNIGIATAISLNSDAIIILNNDIDVDEDVIEKIEFYFKKGYKIICPMLEPSHISSLLEEEIEPNVYKGFHGVGFAATKEVFLHSFSENKNFLSPEYIFPDGSDLDFASWLAINNYTSVILKNACVRNNKSASSQSEEFKEGNKKNKKIFEKKYPNHDYKRLFKKMRKILIIKGKDVHTHQRIASGFYQAFNEVKVIENYNDLDDSHYDITFIDPSVTFDPTSKLNSDQIMFYDCEDDPINFFPNTAYFSLKDKIKYYAKMNYIENDRNDGIKNIAFPLPIYNELSRIAQLDFLNYEEQNKKCFLIGHGTYIGNYKIQNGYYNCTEDIFSIGTANNNNKIDFLYNQRIDWILSMIKNKIEYKGGIVFQENQTNMSLEWQTKHFGKVEKIKTNYIPWLETFKYHALNKIGLCPTGHERISWRVFDLMASGSIIFWTDNKKQQSLFMPEEYITVPDAVDFSEIYFKNEKNFKEIWKASQKNKELIANLTPEKVMDKFFKQLC